jgi:DNA polymerase-4
LRKIIHVDMDAFFASVEQLDHPGLRGRPVVVGGDPKGRGVVAAASYEARRFGIRSAMPCGEAARRCANAVFVRPRLERYREVSQQIRAVFESVTSWVEPLSLDEAYLDVTENALGEPLAGRVAIEIKNRIRQEVGLTASAGVGPNKLIAKIASDLEKPDGLVIIPPARVLEFISRLPVERLWGVGPATAKRLHEMGLRQAGDIADRNVEDLVSRFGNQGMTLHALSQGIDERPVRNHREPKSRGSETTFEGDVTSEEHLTLELGRLAQDVSRRLDHLGRGGRTVTLKVRYSDFTTITRSRTLTSPTQDGPTIARAAQELLGTSTEAGERPIRLLGVNVSSLTQDDAPVQLILPLETPARY